MMSQFERIMMMGACALVVAQATACMSPPSGVACGDMWCPVDTICVQAPPDLSTPRELCVARNVCGNGIVEAGEECDCGAGGVLAPRASCGGRGNSASTGFCRPNCTLSPCMLSTTDTCGVSGGRAPDVTGVAAPAYLISGMPGIVSGDAVLRILFETRTPGTNVELCAGTADDFAQGECPIPLSDSGGPGFRFLTVIDASVLAGKILYAIREVGSEPAQFALMIDCTGMEFSLTIDYTGVANPGRVIGEMPRISSGDPTLRILFENQTPGTDVALCAGTPDDFDQGICSMSLSDSSGPGVQLLNMFDARVLSGKVLYAIRKAGTEPARFALTID